MIANSQIPGIGVGVFADVDYVYQEFIGYISGRIGEIKTLTDFEFAISLPGGKVFIGDNKDYSNIGQFINDSCRPEILKYPIYSLESKRINEAIADYEVLSDQLSNVYFRLNANQTISVHASRNIKVGEELYRHYGWKFWLAWYGMTNTNPIFNLYCGVKSEMIYLQYNRIYWWNKLHRYQSVLELIGIDTDDSIFDLYGISHYNHQNKLYFLVELIQ